MPYYSDKHTILAPFRKSWDIVPHATNELPNITRAVMASTDGVIVTGYLESDPDNLYTTFALKGSIYYFEAFKRVVTVTGGTLKGYV